jgi:hypothetical protein
VDVNSGQGNYFFSITRKVVPFPTTEDLTKIFPLW